MATAIPRHVSLTDAARALGLTPRTFRSLARAHGLPLIVLSQRSCVVELGELQRWLAARRHDAPGLARIAAHVRASAGADAMPSSERLAPPAPAEPRRRRRAKPGAHP